MITIKKAALALAAVMSMAFASAVPVNGIITFTGGSLLDNANTSLATQVTIVAPSVGNALGGFTTTLSPGDPVSITSPLVIGATPPTIWTAGGFTFTPNAPLTGGAGPNNTFAIGTTGTVTGPGFDPTPAVFALASTATQSGIGAFASITAAAGVVVTPDSGSTLMLLGAGLLALGVRRRLTA